MTDGPARVDHHRRCHHSLYRMSCEDFDALYEYAQGRCQICRTPEAETKRGHLSIDHVHGYAMVAVRGLLCDKCNTLMSKFDARKTRDERCYSYQSRAWFLRILIARREAQFRAAS